MKTVKEILSENRESIISSIKFTYKVYDHQGIVEIMKRFLDYAMENENTVFAADEARNTKTQLRYMVQKMMMREMRNQPKRSLAELMAAAHEGERFNHISEQWERI